MEISFSGTREGWNDLQGRAVDEILSRLSNKGTLSFHHGCCVGSDMNFHSLVREKFGRRALISVYPSTSRTRSSIPPDADHVHARMIPKVRNVKLVNAGKELLIATPKNPWPPSGTWHAIQHAMKVGIPTIVVLPDGRLNAIPPEAWTSLSEPRKT